MVRLVWYLKFVKDWEVHAQNYTIEAESLDACLEVISGVIQLYEEDGWETEENIIIEISAFTEG